MSSICESRMLVSHWRPFPFDKGHNWYFDHNNSTKGIWNLARVTSNVAATIRQWRLQCLWGKYQLLLNVQLTNIKISLVFSVKHESLKWQIVVYVYECVCVFVCTGGVLANSDVRKSSKLNHFPKFPYFRLNFLLLVILPFSKKKLRRKNFKLI